MQNNLGSVKNLTKVGKWQVELSQEVRKFCSDRDRAILLRKYIIDSKPVGRLDKKSLKYTYLQSRGLQHDNDVIFYSDDKYLFRIE